MDVNPSFDQYSATAHALKPKTWRAGVCRHTFFCIQMLYIQHKFSNRLLKKSKQQLKSVTGAETHTLYLLNLYSNRALPTLLMRYSYPGPHAKVEPQHIRALQWLSVTPGLLSTTRGGVRREQHLLQPHKQPCPKTCFAALRCAV